MEIEEKEPKSMLELLSQCQYQLMGVPFIASDTTLSKPHPTITSVSDQKGKILSYVYQLGWGLDGLILVTTMN